VTSAQKSIHFFGSRLLRELQFDQERTDLLKLLEFQRIHFANARRNNTNQTADQMLIILGDGRGALADGSEDMRRILNTLAYERITVLYLLLDTGPKSITEMRVAEFKPDGQILFIPYMQKFPFLLYALIKSTKELPVTISEAIRQWFEYTSRG